MKRILAMCVLASTLVASPVFCDNSQRIEELITKQKEILSQIQGVQTFIQNGQAEALKIQGAIDELRLQDTKEKPNEEKKDG